jgi:hypothetical protein
MKNQAAVLPTGAAKAAMVDALCASIQGKYTQRVVRLRHGLAPQPREDYRTQGLRLQAEAARLRATAVVLVAVTVEPQLATAPAAVDVAGGDDGGGGGGTPTEGDDGDPDPPSTAGGSRGDLEHELVEVAP